LDTHGPNAFRQNRFVLPDMKEKRKIEGKTATAAMRIYRPPLAAAVELTEGKPTFLNCEGSRRQILAFAGPWKRKGDCWSEAPWAREEWDVEIRVLRPKVQAEKIHKSENRTALYRVYWDLRSRRWFVEGIYD